MNNSNDNSNNNNNSSDASSPNLVHTAASSSTYSNNNNNSSDASSPYLVHTAASSSTYSNDDNGTPSTKTAPFSDELTAKMKGYLYRNEKASELAQLKAMWMSMPIQDLRTLLGGPHTDIPQDHRTVIQEILEYKLALAKGRC
ncbi:MAG: hypothetical protein L6R42_002354 [Xanthoria sp. 1 TBL-2021]|nr:MAG: hypothetical protein L6R42_002354 [Xanthoria sp. 1 TBL-2021]